MLVLLSGKHYLSNLLDNAKKPETIKNVSANVADPRQFGAKPGSGSADLWI